MLLIWQLQLQLQHAALSSNMLHNFLQGILTGMYYMYSTTSEIFIELGFYYKPVQISCNWCCPMVSVVVMVSVSMETVTKKWVLLSDFSNRSTLGVLLPWDQTRSVRGFKVNDLLHYFKASIRSSRPRSSKTRPRVWKIFQYRFFRRSSIEYSEFSVSKKIGNF